MPVFSCFLRSCGTHSRERRAISAPLCSIQSSQKMPSVARPQVRFDNSCVPKSATRREALLATIRMASSSLNITVAQAHTKLDMFCGLPKTACFHVFWLRALESGQLDQRLLDDQSKPEPWDLETLSPRSRTSHCCCKRAKAQHVLDKSS